MNSTTWPEGVIARYLTVAGQALTDPPITVDITHHSDEDGWAVTGRCRACHGTLDDSSYIDRDHDTAKHWAQEHAEKCRALPKPDGDPK